MTTTDDDTRTAPAPANKRVVLTHPLGWLASGFGVGLAPVAAGTFGSLAALVPWWLWLRHLSPTNYGVAMLVTLWLGTWAAAWVIRRTRVEDPGVVVVDEFLGQWIALWPLGAVATDWRWMLVGFALFRLFDIWKPWVVRRIDEGVHGGVGAMLDDAMAGLMALAALQAIVRLVAQLA
jgi:phosphatidylglycerophosphatase A